MTTANAVRKAIGVLPEGKVFPVKDFLHLGTRAAVDQVLYRMAKENEIVRIARGLYARPKWNKYVSAPVMPEPFEVAELVAKSRGAKIGPSGAEAVHRFGLSTQVPTQAVYDTTGRTGNVKVGKSTIRFRHVAPRKMQYAGTSVGTAIAAMRYLGHEHVTPQVIATLEQALTKEDFQTLRRAATALPGWAMDKLYRYEVRRDRRIS
jgi:hypothetical protein